jgi:tripartite-type tricarboxylate transporter receptor subunit TctC
MEGAGRRFPLPLELWFPGSGDLRYTAGINAREMVMARIAAGIALLLGLAVGSAHAQNWPARSVKIIAPFAPGGAADTLGRIVAEPLSNAFHQQFYVENRGGAGGLIGAASVAAAEPDGYSLVVSGIASNVIAPAISPKPPFDPMRDFTHIAYLGGPPVVLIVHPSLSVGSYKDFLAFAKRAPTSLDYISPGTGTHGFLFAESLARRENVKLTHIPYKGAAPALMGLLGGHVLIGSMTISSAAEQIRAGKVRALAVSAEKRLANFPDVPTFRELGYEDLVSETWFGLSGPARLPGDIVQALSREVEKILQTPEVRKRMAQDEIEIKLMTPEAVTQYIAGEITRWGPLAKSLNLTIE